MSARSLPLVLLLLLAFSVQKSFATGMYEKDQWVENWGKATLMTPEFYWELECKRIARD